uniref:NADH-ubiquinone oxidoreductase chain 6 n=1 Tax=Toxeutes macleayi TaxID=2546607 RepID=A0A7G8JRS2_9CUCU|nr:NADH dehydrogenase subunit 6 [Toxeutes macleayi]
MVATLIILTLWTTSISFIFMDHPLSLGFILLVQTIMISLLTGLMSYTYWFSYILFLIMVGGMLVLFIYMTSVASNEKFKFSSKLLSFLILSVLFTIIVMAIDKFFMNMSSFSTDMINQSMVVSKNSQMSKFINWPMSANLYMIMVYLLITLIMAVKVTNIQYGPLRQKF